MTMDNVEQPAAGRDALGRFLPGRSGNPAGKQPGTRNRATTLRAALEPGEDIAAARAVIERAIKGDPVCARFMTDRLYPKPRTRAIALDLPDLDRDINHGEIYDAALRAMLTGEITLDEMAQIGQLLADRFKRYGAAAPIDVSDLVARAAAEAVEPAPPPAPASAPAPPAATPPAPAFSLHRLDRAGAAAKPAAPKPAPPVAPASPPPGAASLAVPRRRRLNAALLGSTALSAAATG
jgi:hypothetical protein